MNTNDSDADSPAAVDSPADERPIGDDDDRPTGDADERLELAATVELLAEENRRLREEYVRARQSRYRRTAQGLAILGIVAAVGGLLLPSGREVLLALAATGLFGGLLTYYLAPGRFVAAEVGERVYAAAATNGAALVDALELRPDRIYVPDPGTSAAHLFVPQGADDEAPDDWTGPIVTDDAGRGLLFEPTGAGLFREFDRVMTDELPTAPGALATALADGLVEGFELARSAEPDVDPDGGRATVSVTDSAFGAVDRFDHPVASFLAVGFAVGLDRPVTLNVAPGEGRADWLVTCRWEPDEGGRGG